MPFKNPILYYFVPTTVKDLYNPTEITAVRSTPKSLLAKTLKVTGNQIVLVERLSSTQGRIVRRTPWPASTDAINTLIAEGDSSGTSEGTEETFIFKGEDDKGNLGIPFAAGNMKTFTLLMMILVTYLVINEK